MGKKTDMPISFIKTKINDAFDKKLRVAGVFLDFFKAFDTIDNRILLKNMNFMDEGMLHLICFAVNFYIQ